MQQREQVTQATAAPSPDGNTQAPKGGAGNQALLERSGLSTPKPTGDGTALPTAGETATMCYPFHVLKWGANPGSIATESIRLKAALDKWGRFWDEGRLRLAQEGGMPLVELRWSPLWGEDPVTIDLTATMEPVEAKAAVAAMEDLDAWGSVASDDKTRLVGLVGGETNTQSRIARGALKGVMDDAGFAAADAAAQGARLAGLLTSEDARPALVDETTAGLSPVKYTLTGPTDEKDHEFRGVKADAKVWTMTFEDKQTILIYGPASPDTATYTFHTAEQVAEGLARLPDANRKKCRTVTLNPRENPDDAFWAVEYNQPDFHSYMTAGADGHVTIYPDEGANPSQDYMNSTFIHETGHTWSYQAWGTDESKGGWVEWRKAMDGDKVSLGNYATSSIAEDVAETITIYGTTKGSPKFEEYRAMVPRRFTILDKELK